MFPFTLPISLTVLEKKIFLVGPPGSKVREMALQLSNYFGYTCISVGDLLKKEISKKSEHGQIIREARLKGIYVEDELVIKIVEKHIEKMLKEKKSIILEGFPKTRIQGLALQRKGIIPNSFLVLNLGDQEMASAAE